MATISDRLGAEIVAAMKAHEAEKLTTLRMVKSALRSKEIEKRQPLTDTEEQAVLTSMLKQRRESVEQFTKGNRPELAAKEQVEIGLIESYMPKPAGEEEIREIVCDAIATLEKNAGGQRPGPKDIGPTMRVVQQRILASGIRADGKLVSEMVKGELAKS